MLGGSQDSWKERASPFASDFVPFCWWPQHSSHYFWFHATKGFKDRTLGLTVIHNTVPMRADLDYFIPVLFCPAIAAYTNPCSLSVHLLSDPWSCSHWGYHVLGHMISGSRYKQCALRLLLPFAFPCGSLSKSLHLPDPSGNSRLWLHQK